MLMKSQNDLQDMLVMFTQPVANSTAEAQVTIYANCVNADKRGPKVGSTYVIVGMVDPSTSLGQLVSLLPQVPPDQVTVVGLQAAIWSITNDIDPGHLRRIFPVEQPDLDSARLLLEHAGVHPSERTLFK
jgi:hypothetical protein